MRVAVSGLRGDLTPWPGIGGVIEVSDAEGAHLCAGELAWPVTNDEAEKAVVVEPGQEMRDVVVESDGTVDTSARDALVPSSTKRTRTRTR